MLVGVFSNYNLMLFGLFELVTWWGAAILLPNLIIGSVLVYCKRRKWKILEEYTSLEDYGKNLVLSP